ncbi:MFS transporter [Microscilla marina]|uniref:Membrane protein, putative n=1 Tax=Microscilla marina ATCC 23134 TaxID=313606 RepID=A1ZX24_MICM2|nr:MFS transporter [Microscilla marina]EAY25104.1 membrane protein, putative [Microscilla marina ATCC 23134]
MSQIRQLNKEVMHLSIFGSFIGAALAFYDIGAITLFLQKFSASQLPEVFIISGISSMVLSAIFIYSQPYFSFSSLTNGFFILIAFTLLAIFTSVYLNLHPNAIRFALIFMGPLNSIALLIFWGTFGRIFNVQESKRLAGKVSAGLAIGQIIALFAIPQILNISGLSTVLLLFLSAFFITIATTYSIIGISRRYRFLSVLNDSAQLIRSTNNAFKLLNNRFVLYLVFFAILSIFVALFLDYWFLSVVETVYIRSDELVDFLSIFGGIVVSASLVVSWYVYRYVVNRFGLAQSLRLHPILLIIFIFLTLAAAYGLGYTLDAKRFIFFFILLMTSKFIHDVLRNAIVSPIYRLYLLPIDVRLRFDTQAKLEGFAQDLGFFLAGIALYLLSIYTSISAMDNIYIALGLLVILIAIIKLMHGEYQRIIQQKLGEEQESQEVGFITLPEKIVQEIDHRDTPQIPTFLNILNILDPIIYKQAILKLLTSEDTVIQKTALIEASKFCILDALPILEKIMELRYFSVLDNAELIRQTYDTLQGAKFRLAKIKYIEQLTQSKLFLERVFGAILCTYADDSIKTKLLNKLFRDPVSLVRYYAVAASAHASNKQLHNFMIEKLGEPQYSNAAFAAIVATGEGLFPSLDSAFYATGQKEIVQLRIVQAYGWVGSQKAVDLLLPKINYSNQNIASMALEMLGRCGYTIEDSKAVPVIIELEEVCGVIIWNMVASQVLDNASCSDILKNALLSEIDYNYEKIYSLLSLLYDTNKVALIKKNLSSGDPEKAEFAFGLLDMMLKEEVKPMILPILSISNFEEKINRTRFVLPTKETMDKKEVLIALVQRDYKWVNKWTKACAIRELLQDGSEENVELLVSNIVNPDIILSEIACEALYQLDREKFEIYAQRFQFKNQYLTLKEAASKVVAANNNDEAENSSEVIGGQSISSIAPNMKFDIITFFTSINELKNIPGLVLSEIAKIATLQEFDAQKIVMIYDNIEDMDYYVIYSGEFVLKNKEKGEFARFEAKEMAHNWHFINETISNVELVTTQPTSVYKISKELFNELQSFHDEIPNSILDYTKTIVG